MDNLQATDADVIIIGAGWAGLMAAKYCVAEGLSIVVLEARDTIGGVWAYTDNGERGGVMKNTQTTSSRCLTEISDFPMPATYPDFPSHHDVIEYLRSYSRHFRLDDHIRFNRRASEMRKQEDVWVVTCSEGSQYRAKRVLVTSGTHQFPNDVSGDPRFAGFRGKMVHSASIKEITPLNSGKTMVIWGGGESASDIASEASEAAERIYWCIPNGQWFIPKVVDRWKPFPSARRKVADHTTSRLRLFVSPTHKYSPLITQYFHLSLGFNGHGQEAWKTSAPYNRSFFNKSSEVLKRVKSGHVIPKRDIVRCEGDKVVFCDGSSVNADVIVTCSGYVTAFPFLEGLGLKSGDPRNLYKYIFYNDDPTLGFVGFVRPIVGSIPGIAELQARLAASVFSGRVSLPTKAVREKTIAADKARWNHHFRNTSLRLGGLTDHFVYSDQLAGMIGCRPQYWKLLLKNPVKWWKAITSPWNGCQFWLNDESQHERIFETFQNYRDNQMSEVYTFILTAPILPLLALGSYLRVFMIERILPRKPSLAGNAGMESTPEPSVLDAAVPR